MSLNIPSPSAEVEQSSEPQYTQTDYHKNMAFFYYKTGQKGVGDNALRLAIEHSLEDNRPMSISEINSIMEGNADTRPEKPKLQKSSAVEQWYEEFNQECQKIKDEIQQKLQAFADFFLTKPDENKTVI